MGLIGSLLLKNERLLQHKMTDPPASGNLIRAVSARKDPSPRYNFQEKHHSSYPKLHERQVDQNSAILQEQSQNLSSSEEDLPDNLDSLLKSPERSTPKKKLPEVTTAEHTDLQLCDSGPQLSASENSVEEEMPSSKTPGSQASALSIASENALLLDMRSSTTPPSARRSSYLTRKAHRFSSLKKKKGGTLINRIFCNNSPSSSSNKTANEFTDPKKVVAAVMEEIDDTSITQENVSNSSSTASSISEGGGTEENNRALKDGSPKQQASSCAAKISKVVATASENMTLHDENKVRSAVQLSLQDAFSVSCSTSGHKSPPTLKDVTFATSDDSSTSRDDDGVPLREGNASKDQDQEGVAVGTGCIRMGFSSPAKATPKRGKPMKTPGGLVIPTPFTHTGGKSLFPSTLDRVFCRPNVEKTTPERKQSGAFPTLEQSVNRISSLIVDSPESAPADDAPDCSGGVASVGKSENVILKPISLMRMVQSQEDLSTVEEASSSKETVSTLGGGHGDTLLQHPPEVDDNEEAFLPDDFVACLGRKSKTPIKSNTQASSQLYSKGAGRRTRSGSSR